MADAPELLEEAAPPSQPPVAAPAGPAPSPPPRNRGVVVAGVAAVGFFVTSVVFLVLLVRDRSDDTGDQVRIKTTATRLVEALFAYDQSSGLDDKTIEELSTTEVVKQQQGAREAILQSRKAFAITHVQATIKDAYLGEVGTDEAHVIVFFDLTVVGKITTVQRDLYVEVTLVRLSGQWKVDVVQRLFRDTSGATSSLDTAGSTTTTTAAPTATTAN